MSAHPGLMPSSCTPQPPSLSLGHWGPLAFTLGTPYSTPPMPSFVLEHRSNHVYHDQFLPMTCAKRCNLPHAAPLLP